MYISVAIILHRQHHGIATVEIKERLLIDAQDQERRLLTLAEG
jgi:hypothetical protein